MPLGQVDKLAKLVPQNPAKPVTLKQALADEPRLREAGRATSAVARHAGDRRDGSRGSTPTPRPTPPASSSATGRSTSWCRSTATRNRDMPVDPVQHEMGRAGGPRQIRLPRPQDADGARARPCDLSRARRTESISARSRSTTRQTYEMLGRGETVGVFQVESAGMRKALVEMRADRFEDLIALVALYRPGPDGQHPDLLRGASSATSSPITICIPTLEPILKETFGVIIYQEQVMQIAQLLSGYSLGEADLLRRAMGKKIKSEMDAQRDRFVGGAVERGLTQAQGRRNLRPAGEIRRLRLQQEPCRRLCADRLSDRLVQGPLPRRIPRGVDDASRRATPTSWPSSATRRGGSGSSSSRRRYAARAPISTWRQARTESWRSAMRLARSRASATGRRPPSFFRAAKSRSRASPISPGGLTRARSIRRCSKTSPAAGAFDELEPDRARVFAGAETILACANRCADERQMGQNALFGEEQNERLALPKMAPWTAAELLRREFDAAGFFLSGHPLDAYRGVLKRLRLTRWSEFVVRGQARRLGWAGRGDRARPRRAAHEIGLQNGHRAVLGR